MSGDPTLILSMIINNSIINRTMMSTTITTRTTTTITTIIITTTTTTTSTPDPQAWQRLPYKNWYQSPRHIDVSWRALPFFLPEQVTHHLGELTLLLLAVLPSPSLFCNRCICTDVPFRQIFLVFLLSIFPYPGILLQLPWISPYLSCHEVSRLGSSCTLLTEAKNLVSVCIIN